MLSRLTWLKRGLHKHFQVQYLQQSVRPPLNGTRSPPPQRAHHTLASNSAKEWKENAQDLDTAQDVEGQLGSGTGLLTGRDVDPGHKTSASEPLELGVHYQAACDQESPRTNPSIHNEFQNFPAASIGWHLVGRKTTSWRSKSSTFYGSPHDRAKHALRMTLYRCRKGIPKSALKKKSVQISRSVRNALATSLSSKASSTPRTTIEGSEEKNIILKLRFKVSKLSRGGRTLRFDTFLPYWNVHFMRLCARYDQPWRAVHDENIPWGFEFEDFVRKRFKDDFRSHPIMNPLEKWCELTPRLQRRYWMSLLLYAMAKSPQDASKLFVSLMDEYSGLIPAYVGRDLVRFVCQSLLQPIPDTGLKMPLLKVDSGNLRICFNMTSYFLDYCSSCYGSASLSSQSISLLARYLPLDRLDHFHKLLVEHNVKLTKHNIRNFAYAYATFGQLGKALEWIKLIPNEEMGSEATLQLCNTLLRQDFETDNLYSLRTNLLSAMLEIGIRPNRVMHDTVLLNAMEGGDRQTAWSSHRIISDNGVPPTAFTYSILLGGVKSGDSRELIASLYKGSRDSGILNKSPVLASSLIHSVYQFEKLRSLEQTFDKMLRLYSELFHLAPLQDIGIGLNAKPRKPKGASLMEPTVHVLGCMLVAWLQENFDSPILEDVYFMYLHHLREGDSRIAITGNYVHVFNAFMVAFGRRGNCLDLCISIIRGMQHPAYWQVRPKDKLEFMWTLSDKDMERGLGVLSAMASGPLESSADPSEPMVDDIFNSPTETFAHYRKIPQPDASSWSQLVWAHVLGGDNEMAEKILGGMQNSSMKPSSITWNFLINGYAREQNAEGVAHTLWRRGEAGFNPDDWTMAALSKLRDQRALHDVLKRLEASAGTDDAQFDNSEESTADWGEDGEYNDQRSQTL